MIIQSILNEFTEGTATIENGRLFHTGIDGNQSFRPNVNSPDQLAPGGASYNAMRSIMRTTNSPLLDTTNSPH